MRRKKQITLLITGSGTTTAVSFMKGLRAQKDIPIRIVSCDMDPFVSGRFFSDAFYLIPGAENSNFFQEIQKVVQHENVDLIIPIIDYEFATLAQHKETLKKFKCTTIISSPETIRICTNKFLTMQLFDQLKLLRPRTFDKEQLLVKHHSFPMFIKPAILGRSSIDAYMVNTSAELEYFLTKISNPIVQEYIEGIEITVDAVNSLKGKLLFAIARERIQTKTGISVKGRIIHDPELISKVKLITESLHMVGPSNIQCFSTKKGYVFIEINPRASGAGAFSLHSGFNIPLTIIKDYLNLPIQIHIPEEDKISTIRYWEEIVIVNDTIKTPHYLKAKNTPVTIL